MLPVMELLERSKVVKFAEAQDAPGRLPENLFLARDNFESDPATPKNPGRDPAKEIQI